MLRYSTRDDVHRLVDRLLRAQGHWNPYAPTGAGQSVDRCGIVRIVRECLGARAARTVRITVH